MKAFVTGATGFIGRHLVKQLLDRDYEVYALVRSAAKAGDLAQAGAHLVVGDITNRDSMRAVMAGSDVVFHLAAWYKIGADDWLNAEPINVGGTRNVLSLAHELDVPKIIYTSTVGVFGDTEGQLVDENYYQTGPFATEYERTKWLAHYKVALPMMEQGAPIIITMPGGVYGPGDTSAMGFLMRQFYEGDMPLVIGPELTLTYAHVEDIAKGHILAAEKGVVGQTYILAGPAVPLGEMVDFWSYLTGKPLPRIRIPASFVQPFAPLVDTLGDMLDLPDMYSQEAIASLSNTYMARANKARTQLGWQPRSLQEGMSETFAWIAQTAEPEDPGRELERKVAGFALATAVVLFFLWLFSRRKDS